MKKSKSKTNAKPTAQNVPIGVKRASKDLPKKSTKKPRLDPQVSTSKKSNQKISNPTLSTPRSLVKENPSPLEWEKFGLYLSSVAGRNSKMKEISFGGLLRLYDNLESAVHFNYMIDLEFVLKNHPNQAKMLLVSGDLLFSPADNVPKVTFLF